MTKKSRARRIAAETMVERWVIEFAEKGDIEARIRRLEAIGRKALADPKQRLFRPLVREVTYNGVVWRTPRNATSEDLDSREDGEYLRRIQS